MSRVAALLGVIALAGALILGLAGCGSDASAGSTSVATTSTAQAASNAAFCSSLVDVQSAVTDIKNVNPSDISVTKLTQLASGLSTALTQLTAGAKDAVGVDSTALQSSFTQLKNDLLAIPGSGQGLSAGLASAQKALVPVQNALDDVKPECSSGGTTVGG
jgi:ABC-type glycerol-3-phosphate transport system substrate-binding protein